VADNELGDGQGVGEKATLATQRALRTLPEGRPRLIGASMRTAEQAADLAGLDVFTMPTSVARDLAAGKVDVATLRDRTGDEVSVSLFPGRDPAAVGLPSLWDVTPELRAAAVRLATTDLEALTPDDLVTRLEEGGLNLFRRWSPAERATIEAEGKIPRFSRWADELTAGRLALDDLMTTAALHSFVADQRALDARIRELLGLPGA
jgi:transaldolase